MPSISMARRWALICTPGQQEHSSQKTSPHIPCRLCDDGELICFVASKWERVVAAELLDQALRMLLVVLWRLLIAALAISENGHG